MNSSLLLSNEILGQSRLKAADFTPLAIIAKEWQTVALPKDSKIKAESGCSAILKHIRAA